MQQDTSPAADLTPSLLAPQRKLHTIISFEFSMLLFYIFFGKADTFHPWDGVLGIVLVPRPFVQVPYKSGDCWSYHRFALDIPKHSSNSFFLFLFSFFLMMFTTYYLLEGTVLCNWKRFYVCNICLMRQNPEYLSEGSSEEGSSVNEHHGTTLLSKSNGNIRY